MNKYLNKINLDLVILKKNEIKFFSIIFKNNFNYLKKF